MSIECHVPGGCSRVMNPHWESTFECLLHYWTKISSVWFCYFALRKDTMWSHTLLVLKILQPPLFFFKKKKKINNNNNFFFLIFLKCRRDKKVLVTFIPHQYTFSNKKKKNQDYYIKISIEFDHPNYIYLT
jgi:hypothetical protein